MTGFSWVAGLDLLLGAEATAKRILEPQVGQEGAPCRDRGDRSRSARLASLKAGLNGPPPGRGLPTSPAF